MEPLLDACTIGYLFEAGQKEFVREAATVWRIHTVLEVSEEAEKAGWGLGFKNLRNELITAGRWVVHELKMGTLEYELFQKLRRDRNKLGDKDQGELASIALAAVFPDLIFVTEDRNAMKWAIDELPGFSGRVVRTAAWLRAGHENGATFDLAGLERWSQTVPGPRAHWWHDWLTTQFPPTTTQ